jgi:hypothetical protein
MQPLELDQMSAVWGGVDDETTGYCGPGRWSLGQTPECLRHDQCVGDWTPTLGRPLADLVCLPSLGPAVTSAARCAVDPTCPKETFELPQSRPQ